MKRGLIPDFLNDEYELEELVRDAEIQLETYIETRKETLGHSVGDDLKQVTSEVAPEVLEPELHAYEEARAKALGEYVTLHASMDGQIRHFRRVVLEGELLTPQQAYDFVGSPANRCFPIAWFMEKQIPMREHYSRSLRGERDFQDWWDEDEEGNRCRFDDIYVEPPGETFRKVTYEPIDPNRRDSLSFPFTSGLYRGVEECPVELGSVLDVLRRVSDRLAKGSGLAWKEAQAAWFVLTGEADPVAVLQGQLDSFWGDRIRRGTITVTAEAWISAESVRNHYHTMQKVMLNYKANRPLSDRGLALFRFVVEQFKAAVPVVEKPNEATILSQPRQWEVDTTLSYVSKGVHPAERGEVSVAPFTHASPEPELTGRPSWRTLLERWDRGCSDPRWRYGDVRNFHRAFVRAARAMLTTFYEDEEALKLFGAMDTLP